MKTSDRLAARVGSILSIILGFWGLVVMPFPFGVVGGSVAAIFGLAFGFLALATAAWGRWRKTAVTGIAVSSLALLVGAAEVVVFVFFG